MDFIKIIKVIKDNYDNSDKSVVELKFMFSPKKKKKYNHEEKENTDLFVVKKNKEKGILLL